ncbi:MAG: hypothetical protein ACRCYO_08955, partial [Bacteroidia bacterium]
MKTIQLFFLSALFFCLSLNLSAQTGVTIGKAYILKASTRAVPFDYVTNQIGDTNKAVILQRGYKFTIIGTSADNRFYIIELWKFIAPEKPEGRNLLDERADSLAFVESVGGLNRLRYFQVSIADLNAKASDLVGGGPVIGALILPIKLRPAFDRKKRDFDFAKDISLNASIAWRFPLGTGLRKHYFTCVLATGISSIAIDSTVAPLLGRNQLIDVSGYTFSGGLMYEFHGGQIGLFSGIDLLGRNKDRYQWEYQGIPWLSLGIGVNIFSINFTDG